MARIKLLRSRLGWSQKRMAEYLQCSQPTVARMELGQKEPGPVSILLDQLDRSSPTTTGEADAGALPADAPPLATPAEPQGAAA